MATTKFSITRRSNHWARRAVSGMRGFLQYLTGLRDKTDGTRRGRIVDHRMRGPIVWLGNLRNEKENRREN